MYSAAVRLRGTTTRSVRPSILMAHHTITEPCPNRRLPGQHLACTVHHGVSIHADVHHAVLGEIWTRLWTTQVSIAEDASLRGYGQIEGALRDVASLNAALEQDISLNLFISVWSDTVTPVTLLRYYCSSLAVPERRRKEVLTRDLQ